MIKLKTEEKIKKLFLRYEKEWKLELDEIINSFKKRLDKIVQSSLDIYNQDKKIIKKLEDIN